MLIKNRRWLCDLDTMDFDPGGAKKYAPRDRLMRQRTRGGCMDEPLKRIRSAWCQQCHTEGGRVDTIGVLGRPGTHVFLLYTSTCILSPSLRLGKVFSSHSQTFSNKTFLSKRFRYWVFFSFKIKQSDYVLLNRVWFGPKKSYWFLSDMI